MGVKSFLVKPLAKQVVKTLEKEAKDAVNLQDKLFKKLIDTAKNTVFGKDHGFSEIQSYADFTERVPIRDYEGLRPYIDRINAGENDVLWKGRPKYYAKTSGTTSGAKYIPITKESIPNHFDSARNALFCYMVEKNDYSILDGKMIFLSGSPELTKTGDILTGRLSGISNHFVPSWLRRSQLPSYETNCIEDWETKLEAVVKETKDQKMTLISGIPPWVQMYYERLLETTGKESVSKLFPDFSVFVYGGVNFEPYRKSLEELTGKTINSVELYPASEGFIAFQRKQDEEGLWLNTNSGIFYEFIPADEIFNENPTRLSLAEVELGVNYAIIINSNAGLWGYNIGDTIEFVSKSPYNIRVTGRIKHFISAFGEHVIAKEVEGAMQSIAASEDARIVEFTVAPQVSPEDGSTPYHEWFIEFEKAPKDLADFAKKLDALMISKNIYYKDLIDGKVLQALIIRPLKKGAFREFMKSQGKLGGQNKVARLSNDRKIANLLDPYKI